MPAPVILYYDFIDPISHLVARALLEVTASGAESAGREIDWSPFELRPPPTSLIGVDDPSLEARWTTARAEAGALGLQYRPPHLVPWTRKAHELMLHAESKGPVEELRMRVFDALLLEGRDIGRVDVLVELARSAGLDAGETRAVLDVDRFEAKVGQRRKAAGDAGIDTVPTLVLGGAKLEGFHNRTALGTFLGT